MTRMTGSHIARSAPLVDLEHARVIIDVERATVSGVAPDGTWPCPACTGEYEVHDGWIVTFLGDDPSALTRIVCGDCADRARPRIN